MERSTFKMSDVIDMMAIILKLPKSSQYRRIAGKEDEQVESDNDDKPSLSSASLRS